MRSGATARGPFLRGVIHGIVAGMVLIAAGCNQERSSLPAKPHQGFGTAPGAGESAPAVPGVQRERAAVAADNLAERARMGDFALADRVKAALTAEPGLESLTLAVTSKDGVVTLQGTAPTGAERDHATLIASGIDGVQSVKNEMVIVAGS